MELHSEHLAFVDVGGRRIATVRHEATERRIVLFCHGFRGSKIGPNRFFVRLARRLQESGICALRFDQYGSGDSQGDFRESSFNDWVNTTSTLAERLFADEYEVALLGQSMGGSSALVAAAELGLRLSSVVAWAPDPSVDDLIETGEDHEEGGQRVGWGYWQEAHAANIVQRYGRIASPALVFFATDDEYVSAANQQALIAVQGPHQHVEILAGYAHSNWSYDQAERVMTQSHDFLLSHFR